MNYREPIKQAELDRYLEEIQPLKTGFDLLADHVIITDANAHILYANKAVERNTGFSMGEVIGKNPADLWGGNMSREFYEGMWHTIKEEKQPFVGEVKNRRKDGTEYWQELRVFPVLDERNNARFFVGIEPDITERKTGEQLRNEFVSLLGHQMKNPLVAIRWTLEWLFGHSALTPKQKGALMELYQRDLGLIDLVGDLIVIAKVGAAQATHETVDIAKEVELIISIARQQFPSVVFSFKKELDMCLTAGSRALIAQVFSNIILNAAEYANKQDGRVEVVIARNDDPGGYTFSCADNGIGIPEAEQTNIFSKFFRASNANNAKQQGTGLGLFIVKMIVAKLGWKVGFSSTLGTGTTFIVEVPKAKV